jgi:hypothetical protein
MLIGGQDCAHQQHGRRGALVESSGMGSLDRNGPWPEAGGDGGAVPYPVTVGGGVRDHESRP